MFGIKKGLPKNDAERAEYIESLSRCCADETHKRLFDHMYENLSILDNKSASLLQYNSVLLAIYTILLATETSKTVAGVSLLIFGMLLVTYSSFVLLGVVWVYWSTKDEIDNAWEHILVLLRVRYRRTIKYRKAWLASYTGMIVLAIFAVIHFLLLDEAIYVLNILEGLINKVFPGAKLLEY